MRGTEVAKLIRKELKGAFPKQKFSVRNQRGGYSTAISVRWEDGVAKDKVKPILQRFESIDRCQASGEILGGGNTFIFDEREVSEKNKERVKKKIEGRYNFGDPNSWENQRHIQRAVWRKLNETSFK